MTRSGLGDRRVRHDKYHQRAKQEKYPARSIYKLEEIDRRVPLFRSGQRVLDLGCRPGSWMLYAANKVGPNGFVLGIDRTALDIALPQNARAIAGDVFQITAEALLSELPPLGATNREPRFDVVLSDMAPDTTGIAFADQARSVELFLRALELSREVGRPGGHFAAKIFMGAGFEDAVKQTKSQYRAVKIIKPDATRKISKEIYVVANDQKDRS